MRVVWGFFDELYVVVFVEQHCGVEEVEGFLAECVTAYPDSGVFAHGYGVELGE